MPAGSLQMGYTIRIENAIAIAHDLKKQGKNIVFTHGAFDLFHAGHSLFLNKSKKEGDVLIVGVDADKNIKQYKSLLRPVISENHRLEVITNHLATDSAFLINEAKSVNTSFYIELYKALEPSIITLGKKSHAHKNFEAREKATKELGAEIKEVDAEVTSTTKIISSIVNIYSK